MVDRLLGCELCIGGTPQGFVPLPLHFNGKMQMSIFARDVAFTVVSEMLLRAELDRSVMLAKHIDDAITAMFFVLGCPPIVPKECHPAVSIVAFRLSFDAVKKTE